MQSEAVAGGSPVAQKVELLEKNRPQQARAIRTYESILDAASELLVEVGLERISTNLIAERAGITVPALYRYFPNKYSVMNALGARLMDRQNAAMFEWHERYISGQPAERVLECTYELLLGQYQVTLELVGGLQTMHVLQSIAPLKEVRI
jgi:AcrR family transcriptional regulator